MRWAYITVNKQTIARNSRNGTAEPAIAVRYSPSGKATYVNRVAINGPCELIYDPAKPLLKCGARLALVCHPLDVVLLDDIAKVVVS